MSNPTAGSSPAPYDRDADHLNLVTIFHYVVGGLTILFSSMFIAHVVMGLTLYRNPEIMPSAPPGGPQFPREIWLMMAAIGGGAVLCGWLMGILTIVSGRLIAKRKNRTFSMIIAAVQCIFFPFGTALGVCTLIVLSRGSVVERYAQATGG